ncbi:reverse transcriptase domain-containing protein [Tanacetum coccineum]
MKLNPKKCTFGAVEGMFLGYMISPEGIKQCPDKTGAVLQLPSLWTIKEVQSLNGMLASLNRFLSKLAEKSLPLFKTLKKCIKKSDFYWTPDAEQAFKQIKQHLSELPLLVAPKPKEELIVYLSASYGAISTVLMTKRGTVQMPIYFASRALQGPELNYTLMENLVLSLVFVAKRLRRYFQVHPIAVITDQPIKQIISRLDVAGRLQKWSVMLGEHNITYRPRTSVKGQILADFLAEKPDESPPDTSVVETPQEHSTASITILADYEALIAGLWIAAQIGVRNVHYHEVKTRKAISHEKIASTALRTVSKKVLVEVLKEKSIQEEEVATVVEEEGPTWMTPIIEHLKDGTFPDDRKEASKLCIKARQYELLEGVLYRQSFLKPWLRCVGPLQANYVIREIHEGSCGMHTGPWTRKDQISNSRYGLFHEVDRGESRSDNHRQSGEEVHVRQHSMSLRSPRRNSFRQCKISAVQRIRGKSKPELGTEAVIPAEIEMPMYRTVVVDAVHNNEELRLNLDLLEERRERAAIREAKTKLKMTKYYNAKVRGVTFRPGDFVYHSNEASHAMDGGKIGPKWEGPPYKVTKHSETEHTG